MPICSVPSCGRTVKGNGLCSPHLQRFKKHGDVQADVPITKSHPGPSNNNWKGGIAMDRGRTRVYVPKHPCADRHGYVYRYRLVMEKKLGRYLRPDEIVHHEGRIYEDVPDKLVVTSQSKHVQIHFAKTTPEIVLRIRELAKVMKDGTQVSSLKIAKETGVPLRRVRAIVHRETWRNL